MKTVKAALRHPAEQIVRIADRQGRQNGHTIGIDGTETETIEISNGSSRRQRSPNR